MAPFIGDASVGPGFEELIVRLTGRKLTNPADSLANELGYATTSATEIEVSLRAFVESPGKAQVDSSWFRGV